MLERLTHLSSDIEKGHTLGQSFITMVKTRDHEAFDQWLRDVHMSRVSDLERFATGLERDGAAVRSALSLPHSNGQVEGQVNRLRLIKRIWTVEQVLNCSASVSWLPEPHFTESDGEPIIHRR